MTCLWSAMGGQPVAERVVGVEDQGGVGRHERRAGDPRDELVALHADRPLEHTADDALLPPDVAGPQLPIGVQAGELGAGPGPARGAVVRPTGAEDEISP